MNTEQVESSDDPMSGGPGRIWGRLAKLSTTIKVHRATRLVIASVWVITLALLAWLAWRNRDTLIFYLVGANYWRLLLALPFYLGTIVASVIGWSFIMRSFAQPVALGTHLRIYCATLAARRLPGTIWYVGGRVILYRQLGISGLVVSLASTVELVVTTIAGITVGLFFLPLGLSLPPQITAWLLVGAVLGLACLHPAVLTKIMLWLGRPLARRFGWRDLIKWLLAYGMVWWMGGMMLAQIVGAFSVISPQQLVYFIGAWSIAGAGGMLTVLLPSSFGVTELALTFFLSTVLPLPLAATIAVLTRILTTLAEIALSIASYLFLKRAGQLPTEAGRNPL
jgi:glycosyltransferase 2 family protein